jgi:hypothetical protein
LEWKEDALRMSAKARTVLDGLAADRDAAIVRSKEMPFPERLRLFEDIKAHHLREASVRSSRLEIRRRIAEDLVREAALDQEWSVFLRYVRRLQRLGYSAPHVRVWLAAMVARVAVQQRMGIPMAKRMVAQTRAVIAHSRLPRTYRREQEETLQRAAAALGSNV